MISRRRFLATSTLGGAGLVLSPALGRWVHAKQIAMLDPTTQPQFVRPLPIPARIDATAGGSFEVDIKQTNQWLGLINPGGGPLRTTVQGYGLKGGRATYPGPTFVAFGDPAAANNEPVDVRWVNRMSSKTLVPMDTSVHKGDPVGPADRVYTVVHLHGGHSESASDGIPEAWFTQNFSQTGPQFAKETYHYENDQESATLWYHDHALGITRLNVYAGMAGFYLLRDQNELDLIGDPAQYPNGNYLPGGPFEIEIVVQDRMFVQNGALFLPTQPDPADVEETETLADGTELTFDRPIPDPSIVAEFFGDHILVNGVIWPRLRVTPDLYRFRLLNGSDSRFYVLKLQDATDADVDFFVIGSDQGFLQNLVIPQLPNGSTGLLIAPGERYDLVVDFRTFENDDALFLRNFGPDEPFKGFNADGTLSDGEGGALPAADLATTGQVMKFEVNGTSQGSAPGWTGTSTRLRLDGGFSVTQPVDRTRRLFLFEGLDNFGRLQPLLGTEDDASSSSRNSRAWFEAITEHPALNTVERWEVYNLSEDAHPIHLHLVAFEIENRQAIDLENLEVNDVRQPQADGTVGVGKDVVLPSLTTIGSARAPEPHERAPKDTAVMLPGEVTRIIARFDQPPNADPSGDGTIRYVWHCHILSHEDHEMMRPYEIT